jgi:hypothetical protein
LIVSVVLLHIIGIEWVYTGIELPELFAPLQDNIQAGLETVFVHFLTALLGSAGLITLIGIGCYRLSYASKIVRTVEGKKAAA